MLILILKKKIQKRLKGLLDPNKKIIFLVHKNNLIKVFEVAKSESGIIFWNFNMSDPRWRSFFFKIIIGLLWKLLGSVLHQIFNFKMSDPRWQPFFFKCYRIILKINRFSGTLNFQRFWCFFSNSHLSVMRIKKNCSMIW